MCVGTHCSNALVSPTPVSFFLEPPCAFPKPLQRGDVLDLHGCCMTVAFGAATTLRPWRCVGAVFQWFSWRCQVAAGLCFSDTGMGWGAAWSGLEAAWGWRGAALPLHEGCTGMVWSCVGTAFGRRGNGSASALLQPGGGEGWAWSGGVAVWELCCCCFAVA